MNPAGIATIDSPTFHSPAMTGPVGHPGSGGRHGAFNADLQTIALRAAGKFHSPFATPVARAVRIHADGEQHHFPLTLVENLSEASASGPAADFAYFREPLKQNMALMGKWVAAAKAGSQSEAWAQFVNEITQHFFKGSRRQLVMDALILSIDILPATYRADALACLLADGEEGMAAAEEFWEYIGLDKIPDEDKARVRGLIHQYGIGA